MLSRRDEKKKKKAREALGRHALAPLFFSRGKSVHTRDAEPGKADTGRSVATKGEKEGFSREIKQRADSDALRWAHGLLSVWLRVLEFCLLARQSQDKRRYPRRRFYKGLKKRRLA